MEPSPNDRTESDAPPSYETITGQSNHGPAHFVDEKSPCQPSFPTTPSGRSNISSPSRPSSWVSSSNTPFWLSTSMRSLTSSRTSKQVRQTVSALVRDLVVTVDSADLLDNCADACRTHGLDLSAILQEPSIEHHSAIYWGILNHRDALLPSLLSYAAPLSQTTLSEIRLACLSTSNQELFQSLRCQREPFTKRITPLNTSPGADALVLGSMPSDEISVRELDCGQGDFVAEVHINLWQKRMHVSGRVSVEFIARGRIWSLTFFSPPPSTHTTTGMCQVALCLLEHSPPTYINSRLIVDIPPSPNTSQTNDLISLLQDDSNIPAARSPLPPSRTPSDKFKAKSETSRKIEVPLKSYHRLVHRPSNTFPAALSAIFSSPKEYSPPKADLWPDQKGSVFVDGIVVPLDEGPGAELMYPNTPFIARDGTLHARLEARLVKPDTTECVIC